MTDHIHFLVAILHDLASPTPHLIFADWLEEQGETARAEEERATGRQTGGETLCLGYDPFYNTTRRNLTETEHNKLRSRFAGLMLHPDHKYGFSAQITRTEIVQRLMDLGLIVSAEDMRRHYTTTDIHDN